MLSRRHRFHGLGSLNHAYRRGRTGRSSWLAVKCVVNDRRQTYRCAVVVSRKVHKSAVVRNRIRRRVYEILRHELVGTTQPYDIVVTVFSELVATADHQKLVKAVHQALADAGIR